MANGVEVRIADVGYSQSISGNYTNVWFTVQAKTSDGYSTHNNNSGSASWSCGVEGHGSGSGSSNFPLRHYWWSLGTRQFRVYHNSDGTCSSLKLWADLNVSVGSTRHSYSSQWLSPPRIARRTTSFSVSGLTIPGTTTVTAYPSSGSAWHRLWWKVDGYDGGSWHEVKWTHQLPLGIANAYPNSNKITIQYSCRTHYGDTAVGDDYNWYETLTLDSNYHAFFDVAPKFVCVDKTEKWCGHLIVTKSKVKITGRVKPSVAGGTIRRVFAQHALQKISCGVTGDGYFESEPFTIRANVSDPVHTWVKVEDSRGRISSSSPTATCYDYKIPQIPKVEIFRCNEKGNPDDRGQRVNATFDYSVAQIGGKNEKIATVEYVKKNHNLEILNKGNRNLLTDTATMSGGFAQGNGQIKSEKSTRNGVDVAEYEIVKKATNWNFFILHKLNDKDFENLDEVRGEEVTVSFDFWCNKKVKIYFRCSNNNATNYMMNDSYFELSDNETNKWIRVSKTVTINENWSKDTQTLNICAIYPEGTQLKISRPKIERGNVATEWTPAPEDPVVVASEQKVLPAFDGKFSIISNPLFSEDYTYDIRVKIKDKFEIGYSYTVEIPTSFSIIDIKANGKGLAFGCAAINDGMTVGMDATFLGDVDFKSVPSDETIELFKRMGWKP